MKTSKRRTKSVAPNDGVAFEQATLEVLKLFPGMSIRSQVLVSGKKVDHFCVIASGLIPSFRIALECKDWDRALTREQAAGICADYYPLLQQREIDQFLLVTRQGLGPNAQQLFDGRSLSTTVQNVEGATADGCIAD